MPRPPAGRDERGAAVVEFTLVSVLLVALFLMIMQVGLVLHARNVMVSAAQEGARFAANADRTPADGVARTQQALRDSLGADLVARTDVTPLPAGTTPNGAPVVGIRVHGPLPFLFAAVGPLEITVDGHAIEEGP
ncbi:MAG: pilus assembly protein TadE [Actinotalea sp.]|nr:pilus assembly protein TadE [Actinotalea sp.]